MRLFCTPLSLTWDKSLHFIAMWSYILISICLAGPLNSYILCWNLKCNVRTHFYNMQFSPISIELPLNLALAMFPFLIFVVLPIVSFNFKLILCSGDVFLLLFAVYFPTNPVSGHYGKYLFFLISFQVVEFMSMNWSDCHVLLMCILSRWVSGLSLPLCNDERFQAHVFFSQFCWLKWMD